MNKILLLVGNLISNLEWIQLMQKEIEDSSTKVIIHEYLHWQNPEFGEIDFEKELVKLAKIVKEYKEVIVIAKSAGIILALYAIERGITSPSRVVFIGVPYKWALERNHSISDLFSTLKSCLLYTSPSPRDRTRSRMPSSA